uniref:Uncharacterized protein n=1 Tax=Arundo donax TaxID=35708 RepID=A0A0A9DY25_ARUDO
MRAPRRLRSQLREGILRRRRRPRRRHAHRRAHARLGGGAVRPARALAGARGLPPRLQAWWQACWHHWLGEHRFADRKEA